jgi:hypothetical protein
MSMKKFATAILLLSTPVMADVVSVSSIPDVKIEGSDCRPVASINGVLLWAGDCGNPSALPLHPGVTQKVNPDGSVSVTFPAGGSVPVAVPTGGNVPLINGGEAGKLQNNNPTGTPPVMNGNTK